MKHPRVEWGLVPIVLAAACGDVVHPGVNRLTADSGARRDGSASDAGVPLVGTTTTLVERTRVKSMAADDASLYWSTGTTIFRVPRTGGTPEMVVTGEDYTEALVVDRGTLYWMSGDWDHAQLRAKPVAGGEARTIGRARRLTGGGSIVFDADAIYWPELGENPEGGSRILRVPRAGGTPAVIASGLVSPSSLVSDGADLYWIDEGRVGHGTDDAFQDGRVLSMPMAGGAVRVLARAQHRAYSLRVGGDSVFWVVNEDMGTQIRALSKEGGVPATIASPRLGSIDSVREIETYDGRVIYYDLALRSVAAQGGDPTVVSPGDNYQYGAGIVVAGRDLFFAVRAGNPSTETIFRFAF